MGCLLYLQKQQADFSVLINFAVADSRWRSFPLRGSLLLGSQCRLQLSAAATYSAVRREKTEDLSGKRPILRTKKGKDAFRPENGCFSGRDCQNLKGSDEVTV